MCYDMLGNVMIVFSGYRAEEFAEFAMSAQRMVKQEVEGGRWDDVPSDDHKREYQRASEERVQTDICKYGTYRVQNHHDHDHHQHSVCHNQSFEGILA